jgi:hypothetical protein
MMSASIEKGREGEKEEEKLWLCVRKKLERGDT